jgi:hypothetical protein
MSSGTRLHRILGIYKSIGKTDILFYGFQTDSLSEESSQEEEVSHMKKPIRRNAFVNK